MNTASQSETPKSDGIFDQLLDVLSLYDKKQIYWADVANAVYSAKADSRSLERQNTELAKDAARLDRLENFYLNSDSDSWFRFLNEAATSGFRRVIDDTILPQPAPKERQ